MDVREKLVYLLTGHSIDTQPDVEYLADHLISNGVTIVQHGQWLYDGGRGKYFCSACNEYALSFKKDTLCGDDLYDERLTDYCPSCGARMS